MPNESRLDQLREEAWDKGVVAGRGGGASHLWLGDFWNVAGHLHGCTHWRDCDPRVVPTSRVAANSLWNSGIGLGPQACLSSWVIVSLR
jgi:hypothetical protein